MWGIGLVLLIECDKLYKLFIGSNLWKRWYVFIEKMFVESCVPWCENFNEFQIRYGSNRQLKFATFLMTNLCKSHTNYSIISFIMRKKFNYLDRSLIRHRRHSIPMYKNFKFKKKLRLVKSQGVVSLNSIKIYITFSFHKKILYIHILPYRPTCNLVPVYYTNY